VCAGGLFKVGEELLDEDGFVLREAGMPVSSKSSCRPGSHVGMPVVLVLVLVLVGGLLT